MKENIAAHPKPWHLRPFLRVLFPLVLGIVAAEYLSFSLISGSVVAVGLVAIILFLKFKKGGNINYRPYFALPVMVGVFAFGWLRASLCSELTAPDYVGTKYENDTTYVVGYVAAPPIHANKIKVRLQLQAIGNQSDSLNNTSGMVLCYLDSSAASLKLKYGDLLVAQTKLQALSAPLNPFQIDMRMVLHFQNLHHRAFMRDGTWQKIGEAQGSQIMQIAYTMQSFCVQTIQKYIHSPDAQSVAAALIIGYVDDISDEVKQAYINTGAMHVLSVSGLHVGLLYVALDAGLRRIRSKKRWWQILRAVIEIVFIWGFSLVTGASAAVLRAAAMLSIVIVGKVFNKETDTFNVLAAAAFLLLAHNPSLAFQIGFQLSFLAVGGLLYFYKAIYSLFLIDFSVKKPKKGEKYTFFNKNVLLAKAEWLADWVWGVTAVGIAAQIATLPLSLYYFHQFPMYFWLSGLIVIPLATLALWLGIILFATAVFPPLAQIVGCGLEKIVIAMNYSLHVIEQFPYAILQDVRLTSWQMWVFYLIIIAIIAALETRIFRWFLLAGGGVLAIFAANAVHYYQQNQQSVLCVHHTYRETVIGQYDADTAHIIASTDDPQMLNFLVKSAALEWSGTSQLQQNYLIDTFATRVAYSEPPFHQFHKRKYAVLIGNQVARGTSAAAKPKLDFVLLSQNPKIDLKDIQNLFDTKMIVADGSCAPWNVDRWQLQAKEMHLIFWATKTKGAFYLIDNQ